MTAPPSRNAPLAGRCALITGATGGLGFAMAQALAQAGAHIIVHGLQNDETAAQACRKMAERHDVQVALHRADLRDVDQIETMVHQVRQTIGAPDILINNAVIRHVGPVESLSRRDWDDGLAVNLSAAFHLARLTLPDMRARRFGRIINMSSVYGVGACADRIGYITAKTALLGMTRALAIETSTAGITCNAVSPGTVPTPAIVSKITTMANEQGVTVEQAERDYLAARQPTGRFVAMPHVAALIVFLCSEAAQDITGANLPIDGGWTAA